MDDTAKATAQPGEPAQPGAPETTERQEPILKFFAFAHLPLALQRVSEPFHQLAHEIMKLERSPERTVALRKLLESKDAAVRAALP